MHGWQAAINRLEGAYAPSTLRSYRNDFVAFADWCAGCGVDPLPADCDLVAAFLAASAPEVSPATLRRRLAGIRKVHALMRLPDPTDDEEIRIVLRRAKRAKPIRPAQALGLTRGRRDALIAAASDDIVGLRDRALVAVGYDTDRRQAPRR